MWLLLDMKIRVKPQSLLNVSALPIYFFLDHTQATLLLLHRIGCVLPSLPEHPL